MGRGSLVPAGRVLFPTLQTHWLKGSAPGLFNGDLNFTALFLCGFSVVLVRKLAATWNLILCKITSAFPAVAPNPSSPWGAGQEEEILGSIFTLLFVPQRCSEGGKTHSLLLDRFQTPSHQSGKIRKENQ